MRTEDNARVPSPLTLAAAQYSISWQVARSRATDFGLLLPPPPPFLFLLRRRKGRKGKERNKGSYIARAHPESLLLLLSSYWTAGRDGGGGRETFTGKTGISEPLPYSWRMSSTEKKTMCYNHERVSVGSTSFLSHFLFFFFFSFFSVVIIGA